MFLEKTWYKTCNIKVLLILENFKAFWSKLKSFKYKIIIFTNYKNQYLFINKKN